MMYKDIKSYIKHNLKIVRKNIVVRIKPKKRYPLLPISNKFGFDRGTPIDRYYIEKFLEQNKDNIFGRCLEIHDNAYTLRFGGDKVTHSDVADIDTSNKLANIYIDLANAGTIPDSTYDTLIITHTIGLIPEHEKAIHHLYRILKPKGTLLITVSAIGPYIKNGNGYWRYTVKSLSYLLEKYFQKDKIHIKSFGNVLSGQAFWVGMAAEECTDIELNTYDERYPIIITGVAQK